DSSVHRVSPRRDAGSEAGECGRWAFRRNAGKLARARIRQRRELDLFLGRARMRQWPWDIRARPCNPGRENTGRRRRRNRLRQLVRNRRRRRPHGRRIFQEGRDCTRREDSSVRVSRVPRGWAGPPKIAGDSTERWPGLAASRRDGHQEYRLAGIPRGRSSVPDAPCKPRRDYCDESLRLSFRYLRLRPPEKHVREKSAERKTEHKNKE